MRNLSDFVQHSIFLLTKFPYFFGITKKKTEKLKTVISGKDRICMANHPTHYIENQTAGADVKLGTLLFHLLSSREQHFRDLVILCIGSDRITGDSLGPLVGHSLTGYSLSHTHVYGTLSHPVHALNLNETVNMLYEQHPHSLTIAVDASLGTKNHVGCLTVSEGPLNPGLGVRKKLPAVGDIAVTGIVNFSGAFDHLLLQSTRLATVVHMADSIVSGIRMAHRQYFAPRLFPVFPFFQPEPERTLSFAKFTSVPPASVCSPKGRI